MVEYLLGIEEIVAYTVNDIDFSFFQSKLTQSIYCFLKNSK